MTSGLEERTWVHINLSRSRSLSIAKDFKMLRYWTCFETGKIAFFGFAFLILIEGLGSGKIGIISALSLVWVLEKLWGWEALKHSRIIKSIEGGKRK